MMSWYTGKETISRFGAKGPNAVLRRAEELTVYLSQQLGISRENVCRTIGQYWRDKKIAKFQQHNLVGHAFRSLVVNTLQVFGDRGIDYEEEVDARNEFRGHHFQTRSKETKIDIIARRGGMPVALLSAKWRFRHDRVEVLDEATPTDLRPDGQTPIAPFMLFSASSTLIGSIRLFQTVRLRCPSLI
jgi:hypothetical protein